MLQPVEWKIFHGYKGKRDSSKLRIMPKAKMSLSGEKKLKLKREWLLQMDNDAEDPIQTSNSTRASQQVPQEEWAEGFATQSPDQRSCITQESPRAVTFVRNWLGKSLKTRTKWLLSVSRPYRLVILDTGVVFPTKYCMQAVHRSGGGVVVLPLLLFYIFTHQHHHWTSS